MRRDLKNSFGAGADRERHRVQNLFSANYHRHYIILDKEQNESLALARGSINELNNE